MAALRAAGADIIFLWPPCVADVEIIFLPCGFFYLSSFFFPRLISAVADWMSTILLHMVQKYIFALVQI